jgi:hypothetical protein
VTREFALLPAIEAAEDGAAVRGVLRQGGEPDAE